MLRDKKNQLVELGLTDKEALVYLSLLNAGHSTADEAAKVAGLNRSTTYVQIKTLTAKGLVSTFKRDKKTFFAAESPNNLDRLLDTERLALETKKAKADALVPDLMRLFASTGVRPVVRIYEGKEGVITMRNEMLEPGITDIYIATDLDKFKTIFSAKERDEFSRRRAERKITAHVLYTSQHDRPLDVPKPNKSLQISKKDGVFTSDVYVYGNTVAFASYDDQVVGVSITNRSIARTVQTLIEKHGV